MGKFEQIPLNFDSSQKKTPDSTLDINRLKDRYREKVGVPYPITGESGAEIEARIGQILDMSDEDARSAVAEWEKERDEGLHWSQR